MDSLINTPKTDVLDHQRFQALTDGVFAIAMTILIFNFHPPESLGGGEAGLWPALAKMIPELTDYVISFLVLAMLWVINNQHYSGLRNSPRGHVWLGMVYLMFICLIPFTTSLMGRFGGTTAADICFHLNLLAVSLCAYAQWHYAVERGLIEMGAERGGSLRRLRALNLALPAAACLALALSFAAPGDSNLIYLAAPFVIARLKARGRKEVKP